MKIQFLLISLIALNFSSFSQVGDSLVDPNKTWYNHIYMYNSWQFDTEVINIGQDTIVNDTNYHQVYRATGGAEVPDQFYGLIREDSSHRILYKTTYETSEKLLYDFTISEDDTVIVYGLTDRSKDEYDECQYVCDSIRDETFFEIQRKVIYLKAIVGQVPEVWIEGIGSTSGLLHNWDGRVGGDAFYLSCVKSPAGFLFKKSDTEPCIKTNSGKTENRFDHLLLFPNPVGKNREIYIKNMSMGLTIEVYDIIGQLVDRRFIESSETTIKLNVQSGIYIYQLIDQKGYVNTGRLIFE